MTSHSFIRVGLLPLVILFTIFFIAACTPEETPCAEQTWYQDADNDMLGNPDVSVKACEQPTGYVANDDDDSDMCQQAIDECGICGGNGPNTWYEDADGDSLGNPAATQIACDQPTGYVANSDDQDDTVNDNLSAIERTFGDNIDLNALFSYAGQSIPVYIIKDNTGSNPITDAGATLGRVLFYDKALSTDYTVSCASCHQQAFAFGDMSLASQGVAGTTGRHSMRLINSRFADEDNFFWDERAPSLEHQTTQPIQDHIEMGFSGTNGDSTLADLIRRLEGIDYYQELFTFVYGDATITEERMQSALAQFVRSIQSFDSRFDEGLAQTGDIAANFPNFSAQENMGKRLFIAPPAGGGTGGGAGGTGAGCQGCHRAPEFDIDPNSRNNGVVGVIGDPNTIDVTNTRAPSLRDLVNPGGSLNGPLMHDGSMSSLEEVIDHYDEIVVVQGNNNIDPRLNGGPGGPPMPQNLNLSQAEKDAIVSFLKTLTGSNVYSDERWSDPFR